VVYPLQTYSSSALLLDTVIFKECPYKIVGEVEPSELTYAK
jgi:hypothetical protein